MAPVEEVPQKDVKAAVDLIIETLDEHKIPMGVGLSAMTLIIMMLKEDGNYVEVQKVGKTQ